MKPRFMDKSDSETDRFSENNDFLTISWEDSLGKEIQSFWESIDDEFEE